MAGLRERRHAETKQAIVDGAFELFEKHGFSNTVMEQIAEHAGVSRSTLYRRYNSKEDIVLDVARQWLDAWDRAMQQLDHDTSLSKAMATGCLAVASEIDATAERVLAAYRALSESPTLQSSGAATNDWLNRMIELVTVRAPDLPEADAATIAGAYMGAIDTMMLRWASTGGTASVVDATQRVLDRLAPILP